MATSSGTQQGGGGGISQYEKQPSYQKGIVQRGNTAKIGRLASENVAADGNPNDFHREP